MQKVPDTSENRSEDYKEKAFRDITSTLQVLTLIFSTLYVVFLSFREVFSIFM